MPSNIDSFGLLVAEQYEYTPHHIIGLKTSGKIMGDSGNSFPSVGKCYSAEIDVVMKRVADLPPTLVEFVPVEGQSGLFFRRALSSVNTFSNNSLYISGDAEFTETFDAINISRMAKLEPFVVSENNIIKKGAYYIDTRETDSAENTPLNIDTLTLHGYDAMLKTEQALYITQTDQVANWTAGETYYVGDIVKNGALYYICIRTHDAGAEFDSQFWNETEVGDQGTWPKTDIEVVRIIASRIGVSVSQETEDLLTNGFLVQYPGYGDYGYTLREVLGYVGAMYCGNWIIDDLENLKLIQLNEIKLPVTALYYENPYSSGPGKSYSRVTIDLGSDYFVTAGDDTGEELMVSCPWGTQEIADYILSIITGFQYVPFRIENAVYDPSWTLGDKIKIGDIYSYIYSLNIDFDYLMTADIEAPHDSEIDHEYQFKDLGSSAVARSLNKIRTSLIVQSGIIEGIIEGEIRTFKGGSEPPLVESFHAGDLWYCEDGSGFYKINTWYRYNGASWEETSGAVAVAPNWSISENYIVGDVVTGPDGKWYESLTNGNQGNQPPNPTYWKECTTLTAVSKSQIVQTLDNITLSVSNNGNGSQINIHGAGIDVSSQRVFFETDNAHFSGTLEAAKVVALGDDIVVKNAAGTVTYGSMGYGSGNDGTGETVGIVLKKDNTHYLIVTGSGVRMQSGDYSIYVADSGVYTRYAGGSPVRVGTAVFG